LKNLKWASANFTSKPGLEGCGKGEEKGGGGGGGGGEEREREERGEEKRTVTKPEGRERDDERESGAKRCPHHLEPTAHSARSS